MLLQIKELYKDRCIIDEMPDYPNDYYWFKDAGNHLIGVKKIYRHLKKNYYHYYLMKLSR